MSESNSLLEFCFSSFRPPVSGLYTLADNVKGLKNLRYLDLSMNGLEKLPEVVTSLISLQELFLNDTMIDFLPANFGRLVNLKILELRENPLLTLPKSMARLSVLQRLDIGQNDFSELVGESPRGRRRKKRKRRKGSVPSVRFCLSTFHRRTRRDLMADMSRRRNPCQRQKRRGRREGGEKEAPFPRLSLRGI